MLSWFENLIGKLSIPFTWQRTNSPTIKKKVEMGSRNKQKVIMKNVEGGIGNSPTYISHMTVYQVTGATDTMVAQAQELMEKETISPQTDDIPADGNPPPGQSYLTLSPFMGIVKSPTLPGTRIQLEFTFHNQEDVPVAIKGAYVGLDDGIAHFKKFFQIGADGSRADDFKTRLPIVVAKDGMTRLAVEFENLEIDLIHQGQVKGELYVLVNNRMVVSQSFVFDVNEAMVSTLNSLQEEAEKHSSPILFDAMIRS